MNGKIFDLVKCIGKKMDKKLEDHWESEKLDYYVKD